MNVHGTTVLITGASRGLGQALALDLAKKGAKVVLVAREKGPLDETVARIRAEGGTAFAIQADVGNKDDVYKIAGTAVALAGPVDVLIHNASTLGKVPLELLLDTECEDLEQVLAVNLVGPFRLSKAVVGPMALRGRGLVIHISSDAAVSAYSRWGSYSVSKAAQDHLNRIWAAELEDTGVRFIAVDPGEMDTRMHADAIPDADPKTLTQPTEIAARIIAIIQKSERVTNGARIEAASWKEPS